MICKIFGKSITCLIYMDYLWAKKCLPLTLQATSLIHFNGDSIIVLQVLTYKAFNADTLAAENKL